MKQLSILTFLAACLGLSLQQHVSYPHVSTTTSMPNKDPCLSYYLLTQHERTEDNLLILNETSDTICDAFRFAEGEWYRFDNNATGGRMPEYCVSSYSCGTHVPIWMDGSHPTEYNPGPKLVKVCGNKFAIDQNPVNCCGWSDTIQVKYCPAQNTTDISYYVYQLKSPPECEYAYCTTKACELGYRMNTSDQCVDLDECLNDPCPPGSMCINTEGSYTCIHDGTENITTPSPDNCYDTCVNGYCTYSYYGSSYCSCYYGYTGVHCESYMPCFDNPCGPGVCNVTVTGDYNCTCPPGVYGRNCTSVDCNYDPCVFGYCTYSGSYCDAVECCHCDEGYEGVICESDMYGRTTPYPTSMTTPQTATMYPSRTTTGYASCPCYNGGTCIYGYYCHCPYGYTGNHCETKVTDNCNNMYFGCKNGGTCVYSYEYNEYACQCPYNTYGQYCEQTVRTTVPPNHYPCAYAHCSVNSTCLPGEWTDDYTCLCGPGYTGAYCDIPMEHECGCIHGTCNYNDYDYGYIDHDDWHFPFNYTDYYYWSTTEMPLARAEGPFTCDCEPGYTGQLCESLIMSCNDNPCQNGGHCYDSYYGKFSCYCPEYFTGIYCEQGLWGPWEDFGTCSHTCGGGYKRQSRTCLAGYGLCEGKSVDHASCNTYPCDDEQPGIDYPAIDVEIDINDASTVTMNEKAVTHAVAYVINHYCSDNLRECCSAFGYSAKPGMFFLVNLVNADACDIHFNDFGDVSFIVTISAKTSMFQLSQFCDVYSDYEEPENHEENIYVSHDIMKDAVEENVDAIESMTNVDVLSVDYSSSRQTDEEEDDDEDDEEYHGHPKALVIGLSVGLAILGLIVAAFIGILVCMKCNKPRRNNHPVVPPQPIPTVARPQLYPQPQTPHDLFLASGVNGMPPSYQQVVMFPPTSPPQNYAAAGVQNPMYGNALPPKSGALPPITKPAEPKPDQTKEADNPEVNNPAPPSATVYHFQAPPIQPAGRLPPIQQA